MTLAGERAGTGIDDILDSLDRELVGLVPVKQKTEEIASLLLVDRLRRRFGLDATRPNLHMCFTGAPGTGKTTVGLRMATMLHQLGYLEHGHLVHAMRDDLGGEYIGQTAPKTKRVLNRAMGGVLFIDEAYYLSPAAEVVFREYLTRRMQQPRFANARSVRNELERSRLRHAHRLAGEPGLARTRDDLMRIEPDDILNSEVLALAEWEQSH